MRPARLLLLCALSLVGLGTAAARGIDDNPEAVSLFERGQRLMREQAWLEAERVFSELVGRYPQSNNLDLFLFNRAKAQYHFGDLPEARAGFAAFLSRFGDSPLAPYARWFLGNIAYMRGDPAMAIRHWLRSYGNAGDERLRRLASQSVLAAVENARSVTLGTSGFAALPEDRRCTLVNDVVRVLAARGDSAQADRLAALCSGGGTATLSRGPDDAALDIAVLLPFSGELQEYGDEIYNGVVVAAELERRAGVNIRLTTYDTQGDPIEAARFVRALRDSSVDVIIGPLTSQSAAVASAVLDDIPLPLIAPAATEAGLTRLSTAAFQLSPNIELQGVMMADYALDQLEADSAAVLTSTRRDHVRMARAFIERFTARGGTLVAVEYYRPRDKDFGDYINDIKAAILGYQRDSTFFVNERGDTLDPDGLPAHVDALFLPGNPEQLRLLLPQIAFYRLQGALLGTDGWDDDAVYRLGDNVTREAVFPSPYLKQSNSAEYQRFAAAYDRRYGEQPGRLAGLGYDAVRLVVLQGSAGRWSRERVLDGLRRVRGYAGAASAVTFGPDRENLELPLYRIRNGSAEPLALFPRTDSTAVDLAEE